MDVPLGRYNMRQRYSFVSLFAFSFLFLAQHAFAQKRNAQTTRTLNKDTKDSLSDSANAEQDSERTSKSKVKNSIAGTGFILTWPSADVGYLQTSPKTDNIFSKLESKATGNVVEPKAGLGIFSQKISLDLLVGAQFSALSGKRIATADSFENESPTAQTTKLDPAEPYSLRQSSILVEGDARIRFGQSGSFQVGLATSSVFAGSKKLFSSIPDVGVPYMVFIGPQFIFEQRVKENLFRVGTSAQFSITGNQRNVMSFRAGASYSFLMNSPFLTITEKKIVKSQTTIQKQILNTREQKIIQNENVSFIFDSQTINFKFNKYELSERSRKFVSGLGQIFAAQRSDWKNLTVEGHTDSKGNSEYNKKLSQKRAETVRQVLVESGISANDMAAIGYGKERLMISPELTEVDFARNRRVEIKVEGIKDARILQRSITRLQDELFPKSFNPAESTDENQGESQ